jgi:hypothetical protein
MAARKETLSAGLVLFFVFVLLSSSYACVDSRPAGVYQKGRAQSSHHAGLGRAAARNFKSGFLETRNDSPTLKRNLYKPAGPVYAAPRIDSIAWFSNTFFLPSKSFIFDFSPVLNL